MPNTNKPALASATIWAAMLGLLPILSQVVESVATSGIALPPKVAAAVAAVSSALVIIRRWTAKDTKPIKGIVSNKK